MSGILEEIYFAEPTVSGCFVKCRSLSFAPLGGRPAPLQYRRAFVSRCLSSLSSPKQLSGTDRHWVSPPPKTSISLRRSAPDNEKNEEHDIWGQKRKPAISPVSTWNHDASENQSGTWAKPRSFLLVISRCFLFSSDFLSWQSMVVSLLFSSCTSSWERKKKQKKKHHIHPVSHSCQHARSKHCSSWQVPTYGANSENTVDMRSWWCHDVTSHLAGTSSDICCCPGKKNMSLR